MDLISTDEAASILGLTPRRVRQLKDAIGYAEVAGTLVFSRAKVEAFKKKPRPGPGWKKGRARKPKGK